MPTSPERLSPELQPFPGHPFALKRRSLTASVWGVHPPHQAFLCCRSSPLCQRAAPGTPPGVFRSAMFWTKGRGQRVQATPRGGPPTATGRAPRCSGRCCCCSPPRSPSLSRPTTRRTAPSCSSACCPIWRSVMPCPRGRAGGA